VKIALIAGLAALAVAPAASAAPKPIPGIRMPSGNISCFYVPRSGALGLPDLFCNIRRSTYGARLQRLCVGGKAGVDWHGFELTPTKKATVVCSGGVLYDPSRQKPTYTTLAYGHTWRQGPYTCVSRVTGLTCTNRKRHGLFLSRTRYRLF
jgi:hypothetical protein